MDSGLVALHSEARYKVSHSLAKPSRGHPLLQKRPEDVKIIKYRKEIAIEKVEKIKYRKD